MCFVYLALQSSDSFPNIKIRLNINEEETAIPKHWKQSGGDELLCLTEGVRHSRSYRCPLEMQSLFSKPPLLLTCTCVCLWVSFCHVCPGACRDQRTSGLRVKELEEILSYPILFKSSKHLNHWVISPLQIVVQIGGIHIEPKTCEVVGEGAKN